jgi:hypothetical protein
MNDGRVTINGKDYIERLQVFPMEVPITVGLSINLVRLAFPGVANFLLKALTREVIAAAVPAVRRFRFRFGNSDGAIWYSAAGVGGATDRVMDNLIFGTGQFPYPVIPSIFYSSNATMPIEIEDVSGVVPYTIILAFHGSYLLPVGQ